MILSVRTTDQWGEQLPLKAQCGNCNLTHCNIAGAQDKFYIVQGTALN